MKVSYHHANPYAGNESILLKFDDETTNGQTACVLVDSGPDVDVDTLLDEDDDEYLTAVLLTHAHRDHYRSIATNLRDAAPIYTSEATAGILDSVLSEAQQYASDGLGDTEAVLDALEPVSGWVSPVSGLRIAPVPAGHTPGAVGFLFQFETDVAADADGDSSGERAATRTILATGDWTRQRAAGYPGIDTALPVDVGAVFLTGATNDSYAMSLTDSVGTICQRAFTGSSVLVSASGLTGVRYAYVVGHLSEHLERPLSVVLVGQAAKLYDDLGYEVPNVESIPTFNDPTELLAPEQVTIAGPEVPTEGSSARLFAEIRENPSATLVQVAASDDTPVLSASCTVYDFEVIAHPTEETVDTVVEQLNPTQVVITHQRRREGRRYKDKYNAFVWATGDTDEYTIFEQGEWIAPPWMTAEGREYVHRANNASVRTWLGSGVADDDTIPLPTCDRFDENVDLASEGLDMDALEEQLRVSVSSTAAGDTQASTTGGSPQPAAGSDGTPTEDDGVSAETVASITDRLDTIESRLEGTTVPARVVDAGEGVRLLRVLGDIDHTHGERVDVTIRDADEQAPADNE